jgi:hypothetical protein
MLGRRVLGVGGGWDWLRIVSSGGEGGVAVMSLVEEL